MESELITHQLLAHPDFIKRASFFYSAYDLVDVLPHDSFKKDLMNKALRICRFCGKKSGETTFKNDAHIYPRMLGNKDLLSDFECDSCNNAIGKSIESDLASFLGISRTIAGVRGRNGVPSFTSPDNKIKARSTKINGNDFVIISVNDSDNESVIVDKDTGVTFMSCSMSPYIPVNVYKAFLKIALSFLKKEEIKENYTSAVDFLMDKADHIFSGCWISGYRLPYYINLPFQAYLFRKRDNKNKIHTHLMSFYFQNYIISFPIPLHKEDIPFYGSLQIPYYAPFYNSLTDFSNAKLSTFEMNLNSTQQVFDEKESLLFQFSKEELARSVAYDHRTGITEQRLFNPAEIKEVIISQHPIDPKELIKYFDSQSKK